MVDWHSPEELAREGVVFTNLQHTLLGLYIWDFVLSLDFDWEFVTRRRKFRWPLIFYFAGRYCLMFALIGITVGLNVRTKINCNALYTFNQLFGNAAVGFASINLSIRTMALWSQNKYVVVFLVILILGHWTLILQGVLLRATYTSDGCQIIHTSTAVLAATFIYSMVFDFIVMALSTWKLAWKGVGGFGRAVGGTRSTGLNRVRSESGGGQNGHEMVTGPGRLAVLIFGDGLIFFFIAFLSNLVATIFMLLDFNAVMSVLFNVPAAVASTIVASRAVRRLTTFPTQGEVFSTSSNPQTTESIVFRVGRSRAVTSMPGIRGNDIQIQTVTETFIHTEANTEPSRRLDPPYVRPKRPIENLQDESDVSVDLGAGCSSSLSDCGASGSTSAIRVTGEDRWVD